jgi:hypothetical protein
LPNSFGFQTQLLSAPSPGFAGSGCLGNDQAAFKAMAVPQSGMAATSFAESDHGAIAPDHQARGICILVTGE